MKNILIMHSMRRTMLVMVFVAFHLAACGGSSSGDDITSTDSSGSLALSSTAPTPSSNNVDSSIAPPPSSSTSATGSSSLKLNWTPPVARRDGSALSPSEIDGFRVYLGKAPGVYSSSVDVTDGTAHSATVTNLASGTYYLVMTTYDTSGRESGYSPEITKKAI